MGCEEVRSSAAEDGQILLPRPDRDGVLLRHRADDLGDMAGYLLPETVINVQFYEGSPIGIDIPAVVELTVVETEPEVKGATVSNVGKPAKLDTGITIQVPAFIKEGDRIRVDTTEGRYMERAK